MITGRQSAGRIAAAGASVLVFVAPATAGADVYLWAEPTIHGTDISGEVEQLRPRTLDLDGNGGRQVVFTNAACLQFPCPAGSAYSIVYPVRRDLSGRFSSISGVLEGSASDVQDVGAINVTGDAHPDLVVTSPGTGWINPFDPTFAYQYHGPTFAGLPGRSVAVGPFNADALGDEATAMCDAAGGAVQVALGTGTAFPFFGQAVAYPAGSCPADLAAADLTADGKLDLVVASGDRPGDPSPQHGLFVLAGSGDGTFVAAEHVDAAPADPRSLAVADVDGDALLDVVLADHSTGTVRLYRGLAGGSLDAPETIDVGAGVVSVAAGDFDGDGATDVVTGYDRPVAGFANGVGIGLGLDDLDTALIGAIDAGGSGTRRVAAADLDGDGFADLAVTHDGNATLSILRNVPVVGFDLDEVQFGSADVGSSSGPVTVALENVGEPPLDVGELSTDADSDNGSNYALLDDDCSLRTLETGEACTAAISFRPTRSGSIDGVLVVPSNSPTQPDYLPLTGTGRSHTAPLPTATPVPTRAEAAAVELTVKASRRQKVRRTRAIVVRAACDAACTISATGTVKVPAAARVFRLPRVRKSLQANQAVTLRLELSKQLRTAVARSLKRRRHITARVVVTSVTGTPVHIARTVRIVG
jgi:VCBS repeat protein/FG-GAP repeat protein